MLRRCALGRPRPSQRQRVRAFTLVEALMALGVVALLTTIALPSLNEALHRTRRIEAVSSLAALQQAQERHRGTEAAYTTDLSSLGWPEGLSPSGAYALEVAQAGESGYRLVARARASGSQSGDTRCTVLAVEVQAGVVTRGSACSGCALPDPLADTPRCWGTL